jgi:hypothetical protein
VNEKGWLEGEDPRAMYAHAHRALNARLKRTRRKLRLYACACCRQAWPILGEAARRAVEASERFADDEADGVELLAAHYGALGGPLDRLAGLASRLWGLFREGVNGPTARKRGAMDAAAEAASLAAGRSITRLARQAALKVGQATLDAADRHAAVAAQVRRQCDLLRDVFGNPFRPLPPRRFPAHVVGLARDCYEAFPAVGESYPILADALEELGEETAAEHCRQPLHVRGCHVLDWALGRG